MTRIRLDSEERRRAIMEAALPLFARKGFAGVTTKEIARAAGVSEALVFQHFATKAALYQEILGCGCDGDPGLEAIAALQPSTATLVRMVELLLRSFVLGERCGWIDRDTRHRLALISYLEDGEYLAQLHDWVMEQIYPLFSASLRAAVEAGDLMPGVRPAEESSFWFAHHVAAGIAYAFLPERRAVPYRGEPEHVIDAAVLFILRGFGLSEEAITRYRTGGASSAARPAAA